MVSNRVAIPSPDGTNYAGGLAVAVRWLLKHKGGIWFGWSGTALVDEEVNTRTIQQGGLSYVVTDLAAADYQEYYSGFAIRRVNVHFANHIADWLRPDDIIWVHNYHLIPLAKMLRDRGHRNRIGFFLHVPFPPPEILTALPNHEWLIPQLGAYDLVGFQTESDATNFARYLEDECRLQKRGAYALQSDGRTVRIGVSKRDRDQRVQPTRPSLGALAAGSQRAPESRWTHHGDRG
jgi:trehalose 6-phosphate synthase